MAAKDSVSVDKRNAYHEAGHAVASYHVRLPFIRINLNDDPEMNNNPGVLWDRDVIRGPKFTDSRQAWLNHQWLVLTIDFAGRAAEQIVRSHETPFPILSADGINLLPLPRETAQSDSHGAWQRYNRIERFRPGGHSIINAGFLDLLKKFEQQYRVVEDLCQHEPHRARVIDLATILLTKRSMKYDEARTIMERASRVD
jgi:hypothetical protein